MSTTMENLREDVHKPPEQLEREADSARSAVEGTLAELELRLSPGQMLDRVMDVVKRNGGEFGDNLLVQVRNNPVPMIMAGIGVAWLMAASKRPPPHGNWRSSSGDWQDRPSRAADGGAHRDATGNGTATERWSSAYGSARDTVSSAAESATDSVRAAATDARAPRARACAGLRTATRISVESSRSCSERLRSRPAPRSARCCPRPMPRTACSARRAMPPSRA
jgi:hypothetical protein